MERRAFVSGLLGLAVGCASRQRRLTVGSKNFTEQLLLGELLAQYLERNAGPVERRFYLAGTYICQQALLAGRIDLYVEYTGTALAAILKQAAASPDQAAVFEQVKSEYQRRFGLAVMPPLGFNNSFALVMRGPEARRLGVRKLSELAPFAPGLRLGVGYEFLERRDGYQGLAATYGLKFAAAPRIMDLGLLYRALENRQVDLVAGSNTDGLLAALDVAVLEDDRHYFLPYDAVPVVRGQALAASPALGPALERLQGRIDARTMRHINYAVDVEKRDAAQVVRELLSRMDEGSHPGF